MADVVYNLTLTIRQPMEQEENEEGVMETPREAFSNYYADASTRRKLEKEVLSAIHRIAGTHDCEVVETLLEEQVA